MENVAVIKIKKPKNKGLKSKTRAEELLAEGKKYYNFILPIETMSNWADNMNEKPNDRILFLINEDIKNRNKQ